MPEEKKPFDETAYKNGYNASHYDRVPLMLPKGERERVKEYAKQHGESLNAFVLRLVRQEMGVEK
jgi:hypothetical protein